MFQTTNQICFWIKASLNQMYTVCWWLNHADLPASSCGLEGHHGIARGDPIGATDHVSAVHVVAWDVAQVIGFFQDQPWLFGLVSSKRWKRSIIISSEISWDYHEITVPQSPGSLGSITLLARNRGSHRPSWWEGCRAVSQNQPAMAPWQLCLGWRS